MRFEALESRRLLAGLISELQLSANDYVELRGEPNAVIPDGTYLALIDSENFVGHNTGTITGLFELGGEAYGDNGFLVIGAESVLHLIDAESNSLLENTSFNANAPSIFTGSVPNGVGLSAFLFTTSDPVFLGDDFDTDDDGIIDLNGTAQNWQIHDSLTIAEDFALNRVAGYGEVIFGDIDRIFSQSLTSTLITTLHSSTGSADNVYVGRVGDSTGHSANDWVAGIAVQGRLELDFNEPATPAVYSGEELDHVGSYNFAGGVSGRVFNGDTQTPLAGVTVLADTNDNGIQDTLEFIVEPDVFGDGADISNRYDGLTLSITNSFNDTLPGHLMFSAFADSFNVIASTGSRVFADSAISTFTPWSTSLRFRADFFRPVEQVSIDVIGTIFGPDVAVLEAYNSQDSLIGTLSSQSLNRGFSERLSFEAPAGEQISYFTIHNDTGSFGLAFDRLSYRQLEPSAVTDANGDYQIDHLDPGLYEIRLPGQFGQLLKSPVGGSVLADVVDTEHFDVDFVTGENKPPVITVEDFNIDEHTPTGTIFDTIEAIDPDEGQDLRYRILGGTGRRIFGLNPASGELRVSNSRNLDFETAAELTLEVEVSDNFVPSKVDVQTLTVTINDVNEPPVIDRGVFTVPENATANVVLDGFVTAEDPDAGDTFTFALDDPLLGDAFMIDQNSGALTLLDPSVLDFETSNSLFLTVAATDDDIADPQTGFGQIVIRVTDENERPTIPITEFSVPEDIASGDTIGTLVVEDPDAEQTHVLNIVGGSGAGIFDLDSQTGELTLAENRSLDHESAPSYELFVTVDDDGVPPTSASPIPIITINVTDIDEAPEVDINIAAIPENSPPGTLLGTIIATDPEDGIPTHEVLSGGDQFDYDPVSGELRVSQTADLDFESPHPVLTLRFSDMSFPPHIETIDVPITLINEAETPFIEESSFDVPEASEPGSVVFQLPVFDPDNDIATYRIHGGTGASLFEIHPVLGLVSLSNGASLDFESTNLYVLDVSVTDDTGLEDRLNIAVRVTDSNESPDINEDQVRTALRQQLTAEPIVASSLFEFDFPNTAFTDPDAGDSFTLTLTSSEGDLPEWLNFDEATSTMSGTPNNADIGTVALTLRMQDGGATPLADSISFVLDVQRNAKPWQNPVNRFDVNQDNGVASLDALIVLNYLDRNGATPVPQDEEPPNFLDVDGDNHIRPLDALLVINALNGGVSVTSTLAEGEQPEDSHDQVIESLSNRPDGLVGSPVDDQTISIVAHAANDDDDDDQQDSELEEYLRDQI